MVSSQIHFLEKKNEPSFPLGPSINSNSRKKKSNCPWVLLLRWGYLARPGNSTTSFRMTILWLSGPRTPVHSGARICSPGTECSQHFPPCALNGPLVLPACFFSALSCDGYSRTQGHCSLKKWNQCFHKMSLGLWSSTNDPFSNCFVIWALE